MPLGANKAAIMGVAGVSTADVVLLSDQDADSDSAIDFTSGIDSTYGEYIFRWYNCHAETNTAQLVFQVNATDGADYDDSLITSTFFLAGHSEGGTTELAYKTAEDRAQVASFQPLVEQLGNDADADCAGELHLFNPSSTTYAKHFYGRSHGYHDADEAIDNFFAGYINDTTAVDDVRFKMSSGDFSGTIKMWGVK